MVNIIIILTMLLQPQTRTDNMEFRQEFFELYALQCNMGYEKVAKKVGLIVIVCMTCGDYVGVKDGLGRTGISHGVCPICYKAMMREIETMPHDVDEIGKQEVKA